VQELTLTDVLDFLNAGGVLAIVCLIIWTGRKGLWEWGTSVERERKAAQEVLDREIAAKTRAENERDRLHVKIEDNVIPILLKFTNSSEAAYQKIEDLIKQIEEFKRGGSS